MSTEEWPAPDFWCTICDRGAEACTHTPVSAVVDEGGQES